MLDVLFEPNRQKILQLVWDGEKTASEIAGHFTTTFGAVSQHLKVLRVSGLLEVRKNGRKRYFQTNKKRLGPMARTFEQLWKLQLSELKTRAELEEKRRRGN
ncbi:MAG: winged helix-turn-helix transcriptional regulator [Acidobacteria bacterium]|nr:winged helix-turn-helix transcriptional regulator [Acidobacteriota bacterium]